MHARCVHSLFWGNTLRTGVISAMLPVLALVHAGCDKPRKSDDAGQAADTAEDSSAASRKPRVERAEAPAAKPSARSEFDAAAAIGSETERAAAIAQVAWNHLETEPDLALDAIAALPADHPEKIQLIEHFALRMAEENPEQAINWAQERSTETESAAALAQIALVLAETDPHRAAQLLSDTGIEGRNFDVAVVQVLQRWAVQAPDKAAEWVASFPAGEMRQAGIKAVIEQWTQTSPEAAAGWSQSLAEPGLRAQSAKALAEVIFEEEEPLRARLIQLADPATLDALRMIETQAAEEDPDNPGS